MIEAKEKKINVFDKEKLNRNTRSLLLIFDEADLSLHPRWQRMFMKWLTDFCEHIFTDFSVKLIVTTHSPILLSDFPGNSVLYLKKEKNKIIIYEPERKNSFGCNIHSLFLNSFRRLRNAKSRINTAFFCCKNKISPHGLWYNRVD
jgi:predicted ATP-dependent endonuclease of OLD family